MLTVAVALCVAPATLTACATSVPSNSPTTSARSSALGRAGTASANKQSTTAETHRLVTLAALPSGAVRRSSGPAALSRPAMGTPQSRSLIDTAQFWQVPLSLAQSTSWLKAHPPTGLTEGGSSSGHGPDGIETAGYDYSDDRSSPAWTQGELEIGIAASGSSASIWRVDGVAQWLDPDPLRIPAARHPLAVSATGTCPADDRKADGVPPGLSTSLLPPGTPRRALLCRYAPAPSGALSAQRRLDAADAAQLATLAAKVSLSHLRGAVTSCPADTGGGTVIAFHYASRTAELWLAASGCVSLNNGTITTDGQSKGLTAFVHAVAATARRD